MKPLELSAMYIEKYFQDIERLGVKKADVYPKASECIPEIIAMVQVSSITGTVTRPRTGVLLSVDKVKEYGKLSVTSGGDDLRRPVCVRRHQEHRWSVCFGRRSAR